MSSLRGWRGEQGTEETTQVEAGGNRELSRKLVSLS